MESSTLSGHRVATPDVEPPGNSPAPDAHRLVDRARAMFATVVAHDVPGGGLGSIVLRQDQVETARRVRGQLRRDGGCLLADDVGSGKSYVALAVARDWTRPLVVAPAALRTTWDRASRRAGVHVHFASHESLSRGRRPAVEFDGIIVDESHRFRTASRRYDVLARMAAQVPLLMLSATPMQNHERELAAQLALFLGEAAFRLEPDTLARWVVRSSTPADTTLPLVAPPRWITLDADDGAVLQAILALPPPPRAADAGVGGVLLQLSLVRAWASSRAALAASIRRRQRTLAAIEQCHAEGRLPTRRELRSWHGGGDVQLGFPTLLASTVVDRERADVLAASIDGERAALHALARTLERADDPDVARVSALRSLRTAHAGSSILAFSEWASTVRSYWSALRADAGVGLLTAREARIASGPITRDALLARFAPRAQGAPSPAAHDRVSLLLTTDLLSEGVNLQDASVVVHLDLPWNPARLAQRLGRIRRPGGPREVASHLMSPPAHAALLLRVEARLRAKLRRAERTIGRSVDVLPVLTDRGDDCCGNRSYSAPRREPAASLSAAELQGEIARRLAGWRRAEADSPRAFEERVLIAAVEAEKSGWIALLNDGRLLALITGGDGSARPSEAPDAVVEALASANGSARRARPEEHDAALAALAEWLRFDWTHRSCGLTAADTPLRRRVFRALERALRDAPRHRRGTILEWVAGVRRALALPLPLGLERSLDELAMEASRRRDWLEDARTLVSRALARAEENRSSGPASLRALILFG